MTVRTVNVTANNQDISTAFHAVLDAMVDGDIVNVEVWSAPLAPGSHWTGAKITTPGLWTRSINKGGTIQVTLQGVPFDGDLKPNPFGDGNTYSRMVIPAVEWEGFLYWGPGAGLTIERRGFLRTMNNALYWPDWFGSGQTWYDTVGVQAFGAFALDVFPDPVPGSINFHHNLYFIGYGPTRAPIIDGNKYADMDSPATYYRGGGGVADKGRYKPNAADATYTQLMQPGHGDTTLRNLVGGLIYNPMAAMPHAMYGFVRGTFEVHDNQFEAVNCGVYNGGGYAGSKWYRNYHSHFMLFAAQLGIFQTNYDPNVFQVWGNISMGFTTQAQDCGNPHNDTFFCGFAFNNLSSFGQLYAQNISWARPVDRGYASHCRFQPSNGGVSANPRAIGTRWVYNLSIGTEQSFDATDLVDEMIVGDVSISPAYGSWAYARTPNYYAARQTGYANLGVASVGLHQDNVGESVIRGTQALAVNVLSIGLGDGVAQAAAIANPTTPPTTLAEAFTFNKGKTGTTFGVPHATLQAYLETLDVSTLPSHLAFVTAAGATAGSGVPVVSNRAYCHGGGLFTPGPGVNVKVYNLDGTVRTARGSAPITIPAASLVEIDALPAASAGAIRTVTYTFAGKTYTWNIANLSANRVPGMSINGIRLRSGAAMRKMINGSLANVPDSQKFSFFMAIRRHTGSAATQAFLTGGVLGNGDSAGDAGGLYNRLSVSLNTYLDARVLTDGSPSGTMNFRSFGPGGDGNAWAENTLYYYFLSIDFTKGSFASGVCQRDQNGNMGGDFNQTWVPAGAAVHFTDLFNLFWNDAYVTPFNGDVYMMGLTDEYVDWTNPAVRGLVDINNPDQIGPRFQMLSPTLSPWLLAGVGSSVRANAGNFNLNTDNPFAKTLTAATDLAVSGACLPGQKLNILPPVVLTPNPRVGQPVEVLVQFSGANAQTVLTPAWGGVAVTGSSGPVTAQEVSNGVVVSCVPSAGGNLTLDLTNDQNHVNPAQLVIPIKTVTTQVVTISSANLTDVGEDQTFTFTLLS